MLPTLVVTNDLERLDLYISEIQKEHGITPAYTEIIEPDNKVITIEQIREISKELSRSFDTMRLLVFVQFHSAKRETQNAFLKTLEEHPENSLILLHVDDEGLILDTIKSRTITVYLDSVKEGAYEVPDIIESSSIGDWLSYSSKIETKDIPTIIDQIIDHIEKKMIHSAQSHSTKTQKETHMHTEHQTIALAYATVAHDIIKIRKMVKYNNLNAERALDKIGLLLNEKKLLPM